MHMLCNFKIIIPGLEIYGKVNYITVVGDDKERTKERRNLINDVKKSLDDTCIMKIFMVATKDRSSLMIPCPFCCVLHMPLVVKKICPITNDNPLPIVTIIAILSFS